MKGFFKLMELSERKNCILTSSCSLLLMLACKFICSLSWEGYRCSESEIYNITNVSTSRFLQDLVNTFLWLKLPYFKPFSIPSYTLTPWIKFRTFCHPKTSHILSFLSFCCCFFQKASFFFFSVWYLPEDYSLINVLGHGL